jgi:hypothetical protein
MTIRIGHCLDGSASKALAGCGHPRRGTINTRNGKSCKECATCYTTRLEKAKQVNIEDLRF